MNDTTVVVVSRDSLGRPVRTEKYGPDDPLPEWLQNFLYEDKTLDERAEHKGGGYYELPDGSTVKGKDAVRAKGFEVK